jgi:5-methylcytosine-specific restriction protein A
LERKAPLKRKSRIGESQIRQLRPGEPIPAGEPRRYTSDKRGYVRLRWKVGKGKYVETYEHRLVAGVPEADIHHDNEIKDDNRPENLQALGKSEHAAEHGHRASKTAKRWTEWDGARCKAAYERHQAALAKRQRRIEFLAEVARRYQAGEGTEEIGAALGKHASNISRALRAAGVVPRPRVKSSVKGVTPSARQMVHARSRMRCERCQCSLVWAGGQVHHRRPRGSGGSRAKDTNRPPNLLHLCVTCHSWIESNREKALALGLLVHQGATPATVPVTLAVGRVLLDDAGGLSLVQH